MRLIFETLYRLHPILPLIYLVVFANGVAAAGFYCVFQRIPYDVGRIWRLAKEGKRGAVYAVGSWAVMCLLTAATLLLALAR